MNKIKAEDDIRFIEQEANLLLVGNQPAHLVLLETILESLRCKLIKVDSGQGALKWLLNNDCAVILLDVNMPIMDGFETASLIKQRETSRHIPIILVSTQDKVERFTQHGYAIGGVDYIAKPFGPDILMDKVAVFVDLFRHTEQNRLKAEKLRLTERRAAEVSRIEQTQQHLSELAASEARLSDFKNTVDATLDGVFIFDADNLHFTYTNHGGVGQLGYDMEEILTLTPFDLLPEQDAVNLRGKLTALREGELPSYTFQTQQRRKDGSEIPVEVFLQFVTLKDEMGHFVAVARDISERKKAESRIERQVRYITSLRNIDMAITASLELHVTLNILLDQVTAQLHGDAANVLLLNPHTQILEYAAGRGFRSKALQHTHLRLGEGHAGRAALERKIVNIPNLKEHDGDALRTPLLVEEGFITYYGAPLIAKGKIMGVLEVFQRTLFKVDEEWLEFLDALARLAAIAIDNAALFDDLQRSNSELILAYDTTIEGWSRALDLRDRETEGHTIRVTETVVSLARAMGLPESELVQIRRGALLHDIGKMGIPDSILLKPGPLSDEEWIIMRCHPIYAYELLSPIGYLRGALDIPYCHHEKWDGSGYPRGLKGEQIPLSARIFSVVDVSDALRSNRPYRAGWPEEKIREHIHQGSGVHFDPHVVQAFMELQYPKSTLLSTLLSTL